MKHLTKAARAFQRRYDFHAEDISHMQRGEFLRRFPEQRLARLRLENYAIGQNPGRTFCYWLEQGTRNWAGIVGATASKFGIYFGKAGEDRERRFRYNRDFAPDLPPVGAEDIAFRNIRKALLTLLKAGRAADFEAIDRSPLSPMFRAKILSLYFPDQYLAICSGTKLLAVAAELRINDTSPSRIQFEAMQVKDADPLFRSWTPLMFKAFLLRRISSTGTEDSDGGASAGEGTAPPPLPASVPPLEPKKPNRKDIEPDFDTLQKKWREIGEKSEAFALQCERDRLLSAGLGKFVDKIKDLTKRPGYGYDFESVSSASEPRYIEVKTFTKVSGNAHHSRFFLSANELLVAMHPVTGPHYFLYLVAHEQGEPIDCTICRAQELLEISEQTPQNYIIRSPTEPLPHIEAARAAKRP